jgi:hypothetical protein
MNLPYPFESAQDVKPDALGRIALVDESGKVLTHLPLATAHELTEDRSPVRVGDAYIVHDGGYGSGDYDNSDGCGWGYGFGLGYCYCDGSGKGNGYGDSYGSGYSDGQGYGDGDGDGYGYSHG